MRRASLLLITVCLFISSIASADTFGTGANQFEIDFMPISGDASSANGTNISGVASTDPRYKMFTDPDDFCIGIYEITNDQWNKFLTNYGTVTGNPSYAYNENATYSANNWPTNELSWYEAAQFANWLNVSSGYQAAYKFTGTQGTGDYTFAPWVVGDVGYNPNNPFRNSNAFYFLPTEDEWVKAGYWNDTSFQTYATPDNLPPIEDIDANYGNEGGLPWYVGSGSEELNGTFDMMGNAGEWMENPFYLGDYISDSYRAKRGGSFSNTLVTALTSTARHSNQPHSELKGLGFRVASIPEPTTLSLLALGAFFAGRKRRK